MNDKELREFKRMLEDYGFTYVCFEEAEGLHYSQKPVVFTPTLTQEQLDDGYRPVSERRYAVVRFSDEDIDNGNLHFFLERGYTR
jgi:hypothetical protein